MSDHQRRLVDATKILAETLDQLADKRGRSQTARILRATATRMWETYHILHDMQEL